MRTLCFSHVSFTGFPLGPLERLRPLGRDRAPAEPAGPVLAALPAAPLPALAALALAGRLPKEPPAGMKCVAAVVNRQQLA